MWTKCLGLTAWAALVVVGIPARADLVIYSGADAGAGSADPRPNSDAAASLFSQVASSLGPVIPITLAGVPDGPFASIHLDQGVTISDPLGLEDQGPVITPDPLGTPDSIFGYNTTEGGTRFLALRGSDIVISFDEPIRAFRAYFSGVQLDGETISFSDGTSQVIPIPDPGASGGIAFVGFTDDGKSITSLTISILGDLIGIDDVRVVRSIVPEPPSLILAVVGSVAVIVARKRPRRVVA